MKSSVMLRAAADAIEYEGDEFLCNTLERLFGRESATATALQEEIANRIFPNTTICNWLCEFDPKIEDQLNQMSNNEMQDALRNYRARWARAMADEFEAKGD